MKTTIISILGLLFTAGFCVAQDDLPANYGDGWYMATNSTTANETDFFPEISNPPVTGGTSAIAEAITPDISALARSLMNDPTRIYNYVHDHIRYVHYFGAHKGAEMTLLESSGNDFDQCALLVALLRAASFSPSYMFGMVSFPYATNTLLDYQHWVGTTLPNTNWGSIKTNVQVINGNVGYPYFTYTGNTNALYFHHIWVQLTLNGTNYTLDPAFKVNIPVAGINLDVAGQISTNNLLTDAAGTATADYVQNLNEGAIRADLGTYAANLLHFIQTNNPNASVQQIAGGSTVVPSTGLNQPVAFTVQTGSGNWPTSQWQYIPTNLMAVLIVTLPGTTSTTNSFYVPGLQGSRLSLVCTSSGQAQLYQEDTQLTNVQTTGSGSTFYPTLTFQHPFGTWNFASSNGLARSSWADQTLTNAAYQRTNATYVLLYGFDANTAWLTSRQRQLDLYRQQGNSDTSPQVTQETLNVMGLSWLAQTEPAVQLIARQDSILYHFLHRLGRMGQESGHGYFIDVYGQGVAVSPLDTASLSVTFNQNQVFQTTAYLESAFEYALIEQWQSSGLVAASTTKLLELASTNGQKIYLASSSNWTAGAYVSTNISNYSSSLGLGSYISAGYSLLLPQNGSIQIAGTNSWAGSGFVAYYNVSGNETIAMSITPGVNGGYASGLSSSPSASTVAGLYQVEPNYYTLQSATISCPTQPKGDPVNMVDGSFQISAADLSLGQTEPRGLNLTRYYSSARRNSNPAGMAPGWLHSYYCTAAPTSNPQAGLGGTTPQQMAPLLVAVRAMLDIYNSGQPDPKAWTVTALIADWGVDQLSNNSVSVTLGNDAVQFVKQPDGSYTPQANCTMSLIQTNGAYWLQERHGRTFKFGTNTLLTNIVDQYGQSLNVTYTTSNWVHTVTDWTNRTLTFNYTGPNLASVSDGTRTVSYGYTGGDLTSFTDADGNIFTYQYDTNHQVIATLDALNRLVVTNNYDINGHITTQLTQGATNKLWQVFAGGWQTAEIDPMGGQQNYFFDDQSRQTAFQDALGNLTQTVYDGQDHVITNISPLNEVTQFFYDGNNNLTETIDPLGFSNVFTFDSNNNLIASTDARTNTSHFGYNAQFSLIGQTNGNGDWTVLSFHSNGTLASRQDSAGTTTYGYDTNGTLASISYPSPLGSESFVNNALGDPTSHTDGNGNQTTFAYNNRRQLTNTIAPTNLTTKITYDANANLSTTTDARGFSTSNTWSVTRHLLATTFPITPQGTPVITNTYDARDWLAETQNPLGKPTYYTNDAAHRQIAVTDPLQRTTRFAYDGDSHQTNATDAMSDQTAQFWNARGNLVKVIDAATNIVGRAYDGAGNLIFLTNRDSNVWRFQYDGANRLTNTISPLGYGATNSYNNRGLLAATTNALGQPTLFGYDARARMTNKQDNLGTINYQYDANNNLTLFTNSGTGVKLSWVYDAYNRPTSFTNAAGYVIQYRYDNNGNLTNLIYPGNRAVKYHYDSLSRLTNVTDWANRQTVYTYDLAGHVTSLTRPNNTLRTMGYDDDGELTNIVERTTDQFPIAFFTLHYNRAGRSDWEFKGPLPHTNTPPTRTMTFDQDNRLKTFNSANVTVDYDGNLTYGPLTNNTFGNYAYDARNELMSAGGLSYGYDPAGNRTSLTNGTNDTIYIIDPVSSQVLMRITGGLTNYYVHGNGLLYEVDETATTTTVLYYHSDIRGSTIALTDVNGNLTDQFEYSPYGMTTYHAGTNTTPFLYNGQFGVQTDPNGLLYMRARYYNPYISRFLNPDPSGFAGGLNFYLFCNGNPISEEDPFGLYGFSTMYWANLSVTGSWWQQAIAVPLGVLSATVPDAVAVSVNGTGGFIGGGTVGIRSVGYIQQGTGASYSFAGATAGPQGSQPGLVTPQVSAGFTVSVAWSSQYNPSPSAWTGNFNEMNIGEGVVGVNGFTSDTWQGIGVGGSVGPVPVSASYLDTVNYQFLSPQGANNSPQGVNNAPPQTANNSSTGK